MHQLTWVQLVVGQTAEQAEAMGAIELLAESRGVVLAVLLLLVAASVISWFVIGYKVWVLLRASRQSKQFGDVFWGSKMLDAVYQRAQEMSASPLSQVFQAGYIELRKLKGQDAEGTMRHQLGGLENIERALRKAVSTEVSHLERLVPFLATVGSTAPFVGLFGTVWGIMEAFMNISVAEQAGIDVVAGPIAEALIATAIGLMAAIPAVVAYNYFNARIRTLTLEMENFSNDFLNIVKRHFFK